MQRALVFIFCFLALFSWSHGSEQFDFKQWSSVYLPEATKDELDAIYPTWKKNAELVSVHNQQNSQFTMALNKFAHLVSERNIYITYIAIELKCIHSCVVSVL